MPHPTVDQEPESQPGPDPAADSEALGPSLGRITLSSENSRKQFELEMVAAMHWRLNGEDEGQS